MSGKTKTYNQRKDKGLCVWCGNPKDAAGTKVLCSVCRIIQREKNRKRRSRYLKANKCRQCGKDVIPNTHYCEKHYFQATAHDRLGKTKYWIELKEQWERQSGTCAYTDENLTLGVNASLDHIIPISIRPDLRASITNIQWVSRRMNVIKNDMTEEEMKQLFRKVLVKLETMSEFTPVESMQKQLVEAGSPVF